MKKYLHLFFVSILVLVVSNLHAQTTGCGTIVSEEQIQLQSTFTDSVSEIILLNKTFYISAHIVKTDSSELGFNEGIVNGALFNLNQLFEKIGLQFKLLKTGIIDDYNINEVYYGKEDKRLTTLSYIDKTINIYFVDLLYDIEGSPVCGYTFMPADNKDQIFFRKACFNSTALAEQIGHFLNLYHTHDTAFGNELVDQSNCSTTGDLCCDTYADPDLSGLVTKKCEYTGTGKDTNNSFYSPSVQNFMSFTEPTCKCFFSEEQYIRMINAVLKLKGHLW